MHKLFRRAFYVCMERNDGLKAWRQTRGLVLISPPKINNLLDEKCTNTITSQLHSQTGVSLLILYK